MKAYIMEADFHSTAMYENIDDDLKAKKQIDD
jgi:hypothetical protein